MNEKDRKDPTTFLPQEEMCYEIKKKKKKKKKQEDPFKDVELIQTIVREPDITALDPDIGPLIDPEVTIKVENIQVDLDLNDFMYNDYDTINDDTEHEPIVKLEEQNRDAVLLTFESVVIDKIPCEVKPEAVESETTNHFCKVCHLVFKNPKTLYIHQRKKHKKFQSFCVHVCDHCGMSYESKNSLVVHLKRKHGPDANKDDNNEHMCDICALVFKGSARLRMHMRRKHGSYVDRFKHVCNDCGLTYDKECSLTVHRRRKHSNKQPPKSSQWFTCPFCSRLFPRRESYSRHIQRKHKVDEDGNENENGMPESQEILKKLIKDQKSQEVTCSICPSVFSSPMYLKLHMKRKHNVMSEDFRLKCKFCNLSYDKVESLKRHVKRKHDTGTYCEVCSKQFPSREMFLEHTHIKVVKECNMCGLIFASQRGLSKHLRCTHKIASDKTVFCNVCKEGFNQKHQLKAHYKRVHLKVTYTCPICTKQLRSKESYKRHLMIKHPESYVDDTVMPYKCEKCSQNFITEFDLCRHINTEHRESLDILIKEENKEVVKDLFQCTKCSDEYPTWEQLREHFEQMHHLIEETQCQKCGDLMPTTELMQHMKRHKEEEMTCKYCEFNTKSRLSMTQHMLRHTNAQTMLCGFNGCKYKTFYEDAMAKHKRRHVDNLGLKLQCASCPFQTMNKYILKYHEEAHSSGKKKYICDKCDYATTLPANLIQHKYKHSTEKRFKCEVCPFATKYNTSLRFHVRKKHCDLPSKT